MIKFHKQALDVTNVLINIHKIRIDRIFTHSEYASPGDGEWLNSGFGSIEERL